MAKKKKNIVMYFSMFGKNDKIADIISMELSALKLKIVTSGWKFLKIPLHMIKGVLEKDVVMIPNKNLKDFHTIFISGPVWVGKPCPALINLIKKVKIKDKDVVLVLTAEKNFGKSEQILKDLIKKKGAKIKALLKFYTCETEEEIKKKIMKAGIEVSD